jgi:hypothetical protein
MLPTTCTFDTLNARFGSVPGSQFYFDKIEVHLCHYMSGGAFYRVFGYHPGGQSYVDCGWFDIPFDYQGLVPGVYNRGL